MTSPTDEKRQTVYPDMDRLLMVLLLLWSSGLQAEGRLSSTGAQCETTDKADIVLLMDSSGSIYPSDYQDMKLFFQRLVSAFDIGPDRVQIGLVQYSDVPKTEWHLNTHQTKHSLLEAIDNLQQIGGGTSTGLALDYILRNNFKLHMGMRADSQKIAVLITDGESADDVLLPSQNLRDTGIEVHAIGVTGAKQDELRVIAYDPDDTHMYNVKDFSFLGNTVNSLIINLCNRANILGAQCETTDKADIVLLMDSSGSIHPSDYQDMKLFFQRLVSAFDIGPDRVQIGLVQYSDAPKTEWHLNTHQTKHSLLEAIDNLQQIGGGTSTGLALDYILRNNFKLHMGMRADSQKIAVLITDGESADDVLLPSQNLRDTGIEVYTIGVTGAKQDELRVIASDPDDTHMYNVKDFSFLGNTVNSLIINLCNRANTLGAQCETTDKADIVLLMDSSGSIHPSDYQDMKLFFQRLVSAFDIGPDRVQIGLVQYSDVPKTEWHLNTHQTKHSLLEAIDNLQQIGGGTSTGLALDYILRNNFKLHMGMRADSQKIAVLITDGESTDDVLLPSQNLRDTGIEVYTIGVTGAKQDELRVIASDPDDTHMYNVKDFSFLGNTFNSLIINLCNRANTLGAQCETTDKADIVLLMDSSGSIHPSDYQDMKLFFQRLVSAFDIGPDRVQIGLVQYSAVPKTEWHLNTHQTKHSLLEAIDNLQQIGGGTSTGLALDYILRNNFKPHMGMRADSQQIAVLITDGESADDVLLPSQNLRDTGIEVHAIGVADAYDLELLYITADPHKMYRVKDFLSLQNIVKSLTINLCNRANSLDSVRLVNGTSLCSGRLEVKSNQANQSWSSVCEADFDQQDAEVVCRELGCGAPSVLQGALYEVVEAPMWTKEFECEGNEPALLDCRSSGSARKTCSPDKAVGLTCSEPVRLVGGASRCTGTLEVKRGDWRPVYGSHWNLMSAAVVCRELDCGSAVSIGIRDESSDKSIWEISSSCIDTGYALRECVSSGSSSSILEITCSESVRLVGGASRCTGTLEVRRGVWRPVYGSYWNLMSAAVVCRELDCGSPVSIEMRDESLHKFAWEIGSNCTQSGSALRECVSSGSSSSILEITCSDSVRLVNGTSLCSGRLEVKSNQANQSWSSVCEADFDQQDAEVVCRELGCGTPSVLQGGLYGEVEAPMWTKEFQCEGNESALLDCRSSGSARKTCSPGKAVGLTCSEPDDVRLVGGASRCAGTLEVKQGDWRPVYGSHWTLKSAAIVCRKLDCGSAASTRRRDESSKRSAWRMSSDCVQSGSALRECATLSWSSSILELTCSDPAGFIIRLVVLPLTLLLFVIVICFIRKATRGQKPGPQENIELDYYNLGVGRAEGGPAEAERAQAAE